MASALRARHDGRVAAPARHAPQWVVLCDAVAQVCHKSLLETRDLTGTPDALTGGMKNGGALAVSLVLIAGGALACVESGSDTPGAGDDVGGGGVAGVGGTSASSAGVGGEGPFGPCAPMSSSADGGPDLHANSSSFNFGDDATREGSVSSVAADRLEVASPGGTHVFNWRGPALDTVFAVGDVVQLERAQGADGLFPAAITTVRSSSATAVVVAGMPWIVMSTEAGATASFRGLPSELPALVYGRVSCCNPRSFDGTLGTRCDYSALDAEQDGTFTAIPLGGTGQIGAWSVTNVQSTYVVAVEHQWYIDATLLGPATPRGLDAGL
jgi:hypothetical protein